ncbi:YybH family protein [Streptomyces sp. NPDC093097]|uniref:YybH family protein n=1 Tax=Streptomyces sp. NPDC093097 TaxID=3366027 RepID=UPI003821E08F
MTNPPRTPTGTATPTAITDPRLIGRHFDERCNAGDLEGLLALYEAEAIMVDKHGAIHRGRAELHAFFTEMLSTRPTLHTLASTVIVNGDLAQSSTHWQLDATEPDGTITRTEAQAAELFRRQQDGTWLVAIDNPWGPLRPAHDKAQAPYPAAPPTGQAQDRSPRRGPVDTAVRLHGRVGS